MARFGHRPLHQGGRRITTATGYGNLHGVGLGLNLSLGAMLHSTMDVGYGRVATGAGRQDPSGRVPIMRRHWLHGSEDRAGELTSASVLAEALVGVRLDSENPSFRGITRDLVTSIA